MEKIFISDLAKLVDQEVTIEAWVANFRSSGKIAFWQLRDGSGFVQAILNSADLAEDKWTAAKEVSLETSVKITGKVAKHPKKEEYKEKGANTDYSDYRQTHRGTPFPLLINLIISRRRTSAMTPHPRATPYTKGK